MAGLVAEGQGVIAEDGLEACIDAALIGAAQKVEHYEIASYGTALALAERLGETDAAALLETTLREEKATDKKLTDLATNEVLPAIPLEEDDEAAMATATKTGRAGHPEAWQDHPSARTE
jgi:ferritin-like metal-binding protein YciE